MPVDHYYDATLDCSTRKQLKVEVHCTSETVEQFIATLRRRRKETEMPRKYKPDYFARYSDRKPKLIRAPKVTDFLKPRTSLMTPEQVKSRLAAGEDPVLLSIEHWVQNAAHIKKHGSLPPKSYDGCTCALCVTHRLPACTISDCKQCLLGISQGGNCGNPDTAWSQFKLNPDFDNAMNMVAALAPLKPVEPEVPQFYIDGEGEGRVALRLESEGSGTIILQADENAGRIGWWHLLTIKQDGTVSLIEGVGGDTGLDLDDKGRLRIEV